MAAVVLLVGSERQANAAIISSLYNTGVNVSHSVLSDGTIGDPHYTLTTSVTSKKDIRIRTSVGGYPINGPWLVDDALSTWIGPNNASDVRGPVGTYTYQTTFDLTGFDYKTASIAGQWSTDNEGVDILINGVSTGNSISFPTAYKSFYTFQIDSGFQAGINTLQFVVQNDGGPTGLRVEMTGTAAVPEPATIAIWSLLGAGAAGLAACRRGSAKGWSAENRSAICQMIDQGRHN
jgi:hypothetical protein